MNWSKANLLRWLDDFFLWWLDNFLLFSPCKIFSCSLRRRLNCFPDFSRFVRFIWAAYPLLRVQISRESELDVVARLVEDFADAVRQDKSQEVARVYRGEWQVARLRYTFPLPNTVSPMCKGSKRRFKQTNPPLQVHERVFISEFGKNSKFNRHRKNRSSPSNYPEKPLRCWDPKFTGRC